MASFFDVGAQQHIDKNGILSKIDKLINWRKIEKILGEVDSDLGRTGYDVVQLFKCLLLQSWHSLSDPSLEEALSKCTSEYGLQRNRNRRFGPGTIQRSRCQMVEERQQKSFWLSSIFSVDSSAPDKNF